MAPEGEDLNIEKILRANAAIKGLISGLKEDDILKVAAAFNTMAKSMNELDTTQIVKMGEKITTVANKAFGLFDKEMNEKAIKNIDKMMKDTVLMSDKTRSAFLRKTKFELEMDKLKREKIEASEKHFLGTVTAGYKEATMKVGGFIKKNMGTQAAGMFMKVAGPLAILAGIFAIINAAAKMLADQIKKIQPALISSGALFDMTKGSYMRMTSEIGMGFSSLATVGYTMRTALDVYNVAAKAHVTSIGHLSIAEEGLAYTRQGAALEATKRSQEFTFEMGRMSTILFGNYKEITKLIDITHKYRISTTEQGKAMASSILQMASITRTDTAFITQMLDAFGAKMRMTGKGYNDTLKLFVPLVKHLENFRKASEKTGGALKTLSDTDMKRLLGGIQKVAMGVDEFFTMALQKGRGTFQERYMTAISTNPIERAMLLTQRVMSMSKGDMSKASIMMQKLGPSGLEPAERIQMLKFMQGLTIDERRDLQGLKGADLTRKLLDINEKNENAMSTTAIGIMAGQNLQEQALDIGRRILKGVLNGFLGLLSHFGEVEYMGEIRGLQDTSKAAQGLQSKAYDPTEFMG